MQEEYSAMGSAVKNEVKQVQNGYTIEREYLGTISARECVARIIKAHLADAPEGFPDAGCPQDKV